MPVDFEERRAHNQRRVERLERKVRDLRRREDRRERRSQRRQRRPIRKFVVLAAIGIGAFLLLPRLCNSASPADVAVKARETAIKEIEDLQHAMLNDVSDVVGVDIARPSAPIDLDGAVIDGWATPLDSIDPDRATRPHHTYAAWDYGTRVGTPVYAMTAGDISHATDDDGARCGGTVIVFTKAERAQITYCHLSEVYVQRNDTVEAGDLIGLTGGKPGAAGAGRSSGPHLHLQIKVDGELRCPQTQLLALDVGEPVQVQDLPTTGCWYSPSSFRGSVGVDAFASPATEGELDDPLFSWD